MMALEISDKSKISDKYYNSIRLELSTIYLEFENFNMSYKYLNESLSKIITLQNPNNLFECELYQQIGNYFLKIGSLSKAKWYFQYSLKICEEKLEDKPAKTYQKEFIYYFLGILFLELENFDDCKKNLDACMKIRESYQDPYLPELASTYLYQAKLFIALNKPSKAIEYSEKCKNIRVKIYEPDRYEMSEIYLCFSQALLINNDLTNSKTYLDKALEIIQRSDEIIPKNSKLYELLGSYYIETADYNNAWRYLELSKSLINPKTFMVFKDFRENIESFSEFLMFKVNMKLGILWEKCSNYKAAKDFYSISQNGINLFPENLHISRTQIMLANLKLQEKLNEKIGFESLYNFIESSSKIQDCCIDIALIIYTEWFSLYNPIKLTIEQEDLTKLEDKISILSEKNKDLWFKIFLTVGNKDYKEACSSKSNDLYKSSIEFYQKAKNLIENIESMEYFIVCEKIGIASCKFDDLTTAYEYLKTSLNGKSRLCAAKDFELFMGYLYCGKYYLLKKMIKDAESYINFAYAQLKDHKDPRILAKIYKAYSNLCNATGDYNNSEIFKLHYIEMKKLKFKKR